MKKIRCSSLPRYAMCSGARAAEDGLKSEDSAVSLAGTAGHSALEAYYDDYAAELFHSPATADSHPPISNFLDGLDDMTASRARWYAKVMDGIIESHGGAVEIHTEVAMSVTLRNGFGEVLLTGHNDLTVICADGVTLISDWKFNFLEVPEAAHNIQLMGYTLLAIKDPNIPFKVGGEIHTILIAGGNENPFTAAVYTPDNTAALERHILSIVSKSFADDARRVPSEDSCKYCEAKCTQRCPETVAEIVDGSEELALYNDNLLPTTKQDARELYDKAKFLRSLCEKYEKMVKEAVQEDPEGWADFFELKSTGSTRTIKDAQAAYEVFVSDNGLLDAETFLSLVTLPVGKLEKALKAPLKEREVPVKDHKMFVAGLLGANLELKEKAPSLKTVKGED